MICPKCGEYVPDWSLSCQFCGRSLTPPDSAPADPENARQAIEQIETEDNDDIDIETEPVADSSADYAADYVEKTIVLESVGSGRALALREDDAREDTAQTQDPAGYTAGCTVETEDESGGKRALLRALLATIAVLAVLALAWFLLLAPSARFDRALNKAEACMEAADYEGALEQYGKALSIRDSAEALQGRAAAWLNLGQPDQALICYEDLLKLDPSLSSTYASMADVYLAQGDYRGAMNILDRGIQATGAEALSRQLSALLDQLGITNYTAEEVAASDNMWPIGAAKEGTGQSIATDIDVVAVLDRQSGVLTISRNGIDSDGVMADLALYQGQDTEAQTGYWPWLDQTESAPITQVKIGGGVTNIGAGAFSGCSELKSVSLGADVAEIGQAAFNGCTALALIEFAEDSHLTKVGPAAFRDCAGLHELRLPDTVESLGSNCFYGSGLLELTLPAAMTKLEQGALNSCPVLTTVNVDTAMTDLGQVPFYRCPKLQVINVPTDNVNYSSFDGLLYDKSGATLLRCPEGRELCSFNPDLEAVGDRAFYACAKLTGVDLPRGLTSIGREAFAFCPQLSYIYLPASLETIGSRAFVYCGALEKLALDDGSKSFRLSGDMLLSGDGATLICCPAASANGRSNGVMRLNRSIRTVAEGACVGCHMSGLICTAVYDIGAAAFADCSSLSSVVLPDTVNSIGSGAFNGSSDLFIYCKAGSYAEEYARTTGYEVQRLSDFVMNIFN